MERISDALHRPGVAAPQIFSRLASGEGFVPYGSMRVPLVRIAALLCFLAVAFGAFGAHALKHTLEASGLTDAWKTAVLYHFLHAIALLVLALLGAGPRAVWWLLFSGIIIFSGSLYVLCLTNALWLGRITPIGGLLFLAGWLWLAIAPRRS